MKHAPDNHHRLLGGLLLIGAGLLILVAVLAVLLAQQQAARQATAGRRVWAAAEPPSGPALRPAPATPVSAPPLATPLPTAAGMLVEAAAPDWPQEQLARRAAPGGRPLRLVIPDLDIDAPVRLAEVVVEAYGDKQAARWTVPDEYAAGWHAGSAGVGRPGNTVLNGHNNVHGAIFKDLVDLGLGAHIILHDAQGARTYAVRDRHFLPEAGLSYRERLQNAQWIAPTADERLTLVTCWPFATNSHRLIVIAEPVETGET